MLFWGFPHPTPHPPPIFSICKAESRGINLELRTVLSDVQSIRGLHCLFSLQIIPVLSLPPGAMYPLSLKKLWENSEMDWRMWVWSWRQLAECGHELVWLAEVDKEFCGSHVRFCGESCLLISICKNIAVPLVLWCSVAMKYLLILDVSESVYRRYQGNEII